MNQKDQVQRSGVKCDQELEGQERKGKVRRTGIECEKVECCVSVGEEQNR